MTTTIITNNVPRFTVDGIDLAPKERKEFDYYSDEEIAFKTFVRYKNWVYEVGEFQIIRSPGSSIRSNDYRTNDVNDPLRNWDGIHSDSYFSGVLIKILKDNERVIMGRYYS